MTQRIALVTGGSRGLGKNAALKLADKGTDIIFTYNSQLQAALDVVAEIERKGRKAAAIQLNVSDVAGFESFAREVQAQLKSMWNRESFDYLVNNAGIGLYGTFADTSEAMFDQLVNIHFTPLLPDPASVAVDPEWRQDPECFIGTGAFCAARICRLCLNERGDGSTDALSGERTGRAGDFSKHHRAWGD